VLFAVAELLVTSPILVQSYNYCHW